MPSFLRRQHLANIPLVVNSGDDVHPVPMSGPSPEKATRDTASEKGLSYRLQSDHDPLNPLGTTQYTSLSDNPRHCSIIPLVLRESSPIRAISSSMCRLLRGTVRRTSQVHSASSVALPFISSGRNLRSLSLTERTRTPCGSIHSNRNSSLSLCFSIII